MHVVKVTQDGNALDLSVKDKAIHYEVQGVDLPVLSDFSFAVWHVLPFAMAKRFDFHIDAPVDDVVIENAIRMTRIWELWQPEKFRELKITASASAVAAKPAAARSVTMFSGGVDSINMLLEMGRQESTQDVLTVHGMEYKHWEGEKFAALCAKTDPILKDLNFRRIVLKSNAREIARGEHGWAMSLAGSSFLLNAVYSEGNFASDYSQAQDVVTHPWGSNHITNALFFGREFRLKPWSETVARTQKVKTISANPAAVRSISCCNDKSVRPDNCGACKKCLRTKMMFLAATGEIPPIFNDLSMPDVSVSKMRLKGKGEWPFFVDMYQHARLNGTIAKVPGLEQGYQALRQSMKRRIFLKKLIDESWL